MSIWKRIKQREIQKFLETATPQEILERWKELQGLHLGDRHRDGVFIDLFAGDRILFDANATLYRNLISWIRERRRRLRNRRIDADAQAWRRCYRVDAICPRVVGEKK